MAEHGPELDALGGAPELGAWMPPHRVLVAQLPEDLVGEPVAVDVVPREVDLEERRGAHPGEPTELRSTSRLCVSDGRTLAPPQDAPPTGGGSADS